MSNQGTFCLPEVTLRQRLRAAVDSDRFQSLQGSDSVEQACPHHPMGLRNGTCSALGLGLGVVVRSGRYNHNTKMNGKDGDQVLCR